MWAQQEGLRDQLLAVRMLRAVMYTAVSCFCLFDPRMQVLLQQGRRTLVHLLPQTACKVDCVCVTFV